MKKPLLAVIGSVPVAGNTAEGNFAIMIGPDPLPQMGSDPIFPARYRHP